MELNTFVSDYLIRAVAVVVGGVFNPPDRRTLLHYIHGREHHGVFALYSFESEEAIACKVYYSYAFC